MTQHPPAAIVLWRGSKAAESGGMVRFLPQDDRLLRHVEVVLAQLILVQNHHHHHDDTTMMIIIVILMLGLQQDQVLPA